MPTSDDFIATISANGQIYSAWESVIVQVEYGSPMRVFEFTPTEGAYGPSYETFGLIPGNPVTISLGGEQVINGRVTTRSVAYDDKSHQIVIAGKSLTGDLVQSSVVVKPGTYDGYTFEQAARAVMAPHPVNLVMSNPPPIASKPFTNLSVQYGETVAEFIQRIAMMRGIFLWDDANGNLNAGQAPSAGASADLVEGQNILRAHMVWDNQLQYNKYKGVGQQPGTDTNWPPRAISATGIDPNYPSNWVKLLLAEHPGDAEDMASRVNYEMAMKGQSGLRVEVIVVGWKKPSGKLWSTDDLVTLLSPMLFPTQATPITFGIQSLTFGQDDANGTTTMLNLVLPQYRRTAIYSGLTDIPVATGLPSQPVAPATPDEPDWRGG